MNVHDEIRFWNDLKLFDKDEIMDLVGRSVAYKPNLAAKLIKSRSKMVKAIVTAYPELSYEQAVMQAVDQTRRGDDTDIWEQIKRLYA